MPSYLEEKQLEVNAAVARGLIELTKVITILVKENKDLNESVKELRAEMEISNGLKRNSL